MAGEKYVHGFCLRCLLSGQEVEEEAGHLGSHLAVLPS